jgi:hypothetical protein
MHELPTTAWILIICSTVPWIIMTAIYCFNNTGGRPAARSRHEDG